MDLEHRINSIRARIRDMYLHLGYDAKGIHKRNSAQVEEKSSVVEVDRTPENDKNSELDALRRALTSSK